MDDTALIDEADFKDAPAPEPKLSFDDLEYIAGRWVTGTRCIDNGESKTTILVLDKTDIQALNQIWQLLRMLKPRQRDLAKLLSRRKA